MKQVTARFKSLDSWVAMCFVLLSTNCLAGSHTAHWKIFLSDDQVQDQPFSRTQLNDSSKWEINQNSTLPQSSTSSQVVIVEKSQNVTKKSDTATATYDNLPAEAIEENESEFENRTTVVPFKMLESLTPTMISTLSSTLITVPMNSTPTVIPITSMMPTQLLSTPSLFTMFPQPNFLSLLGVPNVPSSSPPSVTFTTTPPPTSSLATNSSTIKAIRDNSTASSSTVPSSTVHTITELPTLPPFDMRSLPSLFQMAKLIPAMVQSFSGRSELLPAVQSGGSPIGGALGTGSGSLYQALTGKTLASGEVLPTSSAVLNAGGEYGGLAPPFIANAAPTIKSQQLEPNIESSLKQHQNTTFDFENYALNEHENLRPQPQNNRGVGPLSGGAKLFSAKKNKPETEMESDRLLKRKNEKNRDDRTMWRGTLQRSTLSGLSKFKQNRLIEPISVNHYGTDYDKPLRSEIHVETPLENLPPATINLPPNMPQQIWQRRNSFRRRTNSNKDSLNKDESQNDENEIKNLNEHLTTHLKNPLENRSEHSFLSPFANEPHVMEEISNENAAKKSTSSPYVAPMPSKERFDFQMTQSATKTAEHRRERPRYHMADYDGSDNSIIHNGIFKNQNEETRNENQSEKTIKNSNGENEKNKMKNEGGLERSEFPSLSGRIQQQFNKLISNAKDFDLPNESNPTSKSNMSDIEQQLISVDGIHGLNADIMRDLTSIKDLPDLGELTRGMDLSLLSKPGGFTELKQQFIQRLIRKSMLKAQQQQHLQN